MKSKSRKQFQRGVRIGFLPATYPSHKEGNIPSKHLHHVTVMAHSTLNLIYLVSLLLVCLVCKLFWRNRDHLAFNHESTIPCIELVLKSKWLNICVVNKNELWVICFSKISCETIFDLDPLVVKYLKGNACKWSARKPFQKSDWYGAQVVSRLTFIINGFGFQNTM